MAHAVVESVVGLEKVRKPTKGHQEVVSSRVYIVFTTTTLLPKKDFIQCFKKNKLKQNIGNNTQKN